MCVSVVVLNCCSCCVVVLRVGVLCCGGVAVLLSVGLIACVIVC